MAEIKCEGDCLACQHRINREVDPRECASMFGFMHTQQAIKDVRTMQELLLTMHAELIEKISTVSAGVNVLDTPEISLESNLLNRDITA